MASVPNSNSPQADHILFHSDGLADTTRLGTVLASALQRGDLVCITGPLGAGKSELCRAIIRARAKDNGLEVPSPSYTLVNVYEETGVHIWHSDLYRIGDESELVEIGLYDAIETAIVLVEWPDRWPDLPERRMDITINPRGEDARTITLMPLGEGWQDLMKRVDQAT